MEVKSLAKKDRFSINGALCKQASFRSTLNVSGYKSLVLAFSHTSFRQLRKMSGICFLAHVSGLVSLEKGWRAKLKNVIFSAFSSHQPTYSPERAGKCQPHTCVKAEF